MSIEIDDQWDDVADPDPQPPTPGTFLPTLSERIHARIQTARYTLPGAADDHYLLDAASVMPIIERLIAIAATAEQLLNCAAEFSKDIVCCSEYFQAADDKIDDLKKVVGP